MLRVFCHRACRVLVLLAVGSSHACFADQLTTEQRERAEALRGVLARAAGRWENPNYPTIVTLQVEAPMLQDLELLRRKATGTYSECKKSGEAIGRGKWQFDERGSGSLAWPPVGREPGGSSRAFLVAESILAIQPFTVHGGLNGDGLVLFRQKYDFEGIETRPILSTEAHQGRIQGRWTHENLDMVHEATKEGQWLERRKRGGIHNQGMWQIHDDGTYGVQLDNKWRLRAWPRGNDTLVVVWFDDKGALHGDGAILSRD